MTVVLKSGIWGNDRSIVIQGIEEKGIVIVEAGLIMKMYKNGFTAEQIFSVNKMVGIKPPSL